LEFSKLLLRGMANCNPQVMAYHHQAVEKHDLVVFATPRGRL